MYGNRNNVVDLQITLPSMEITFDSTYHEIKIFPMLGHLFMNAQGIPMEKLHTIDQTIAREV